jgi:hypothetical protein
MHRREEAPLVKLMMTNGESLEIDFLGSSSEGLDKLYYKFGVKLHDLNGHLVYQNQMTFTETQSMRRRNRSIKRQGPEKIVANMMIDSGTHTRERDEAMLEMLIHLRRVRLARG